MFPDSTQELKSKVLDLLLTHSRPPDIDVIESVLRMVSAEIRFTYENYINGFIDGKNDNTTKSKRYRFHRYIKD